MVSKFGHSMTLGSVHRIAVHTREWMREWRRCSAFPLAFSFYSQCMLYQNQVMNAVDSQVLAFVQLVYSKIVLRLINSSLQ